jgi:alanine racemase
MIKNIWQKKNMLICIAPIGYADGLPRSSSGKLHVIINGTRRKVLGNLSMDQIVIEAHPNDAVGNTVLLFGGAAIQTIYDVADASNTIPYEIMTRVNSSMRVAIKYINV